MKVKGTFEFFLNDDGKHASFIIKFDEPPSKEVENWLRSAYCNDLVWRIHGMGGGSQRGFPILLGESKRLTSFLGLL
jgi:hypothetical protein